MTAPALPKAQYDVLNAVALKKMATTASVAAACRLGRSEVEGAMDELAGQGLLILADGTAFPSDAAESALAESAAEHYVPVRQDGDIDSLVEKFETHNARFLDTMSAWQQVDVGGRKVINDHADSAYDDRIISRLERLVQRLTPLLKALAGHDPRFAAYVERFETAVTEIDGGRHELVSSPTADSVHNIWFEFHEDLLRTLGRARQE
jgi:hypothetical protein